MARSSAKKPGPAKCRGSSAQIEGRDWVRVGGNKWLREVAEHALLLRHVSLEAMLVIEEQMRPAALDHERVERRQDMHEVRLLCVRGFDQLRRGPMFAAA